MSPPLLTLPLTEKIDAAGRTLARRQEAARRAADSAADAARAAEDTWDQCLPRLIDAESSWLVAHSDLPPATAFPAPPIPPAYTVLATDGSQIAADRHDGFEDCLLLRVGRVRIHYGTGARARLDSVSDLFVDEDEEGFGGEGAGARRFGYEIGALREMLLETPDDAPAALALTDGSLIAWHLDPQQTSDREALATLLALFDTAQERRVPVAGYVSRPASRDVVNALRVLACPEEPLRCSQRRDSCDCVGLRPARDADLFARLLSPGQRSPLFTAQGQRTGYSRILERYGARWIGFFYLHAGAEIARVEVPAWVGQEPELLDRVHAICLDQAQKGQGYPVALAEAHEQAVLRGPDRALFLHRLTGALARAGGAASPSRKGRFKRLPGA